MPTYTLTLTGSQPITDEAIGANELFQVNAGAGNPSPCYEATGAVLFSGASDNAKGYIGSTSDTWETLFGVTHGETIVSVQLTGHDYKCVTPVTAAGAASTLKIRPIDNAGANLAAADLISEALPTAAGAWTPGGGGSSQTVNPGHTVSTSKVRIELENPVQQGSSGLGGANPDYQFDNIAIVVTTTAVTTDNPPFSHLGRIAAVAAIVATSYAFPPPPSPFMGGRQPLQGRVLPASITAVRVDNPPLSHRGRIGQTLSVIRQWDPPPPNAFEGGHQPAAPPVLSPAILAVRVDSPPFSHPGRLLSAHFQVLASQPPPPLPFMGGWQPLAQRILNASLTAVRVDPPPFSDPGRSEKVFRLLLASQPPPPEAFMGAKQPLAWLKIDPTVASNLKFSQCRDNTGLGWTVETQIDIGVELSSAAGVWLGNAYGALYEKEGKVWWLESPDGITWQPVAKRDTGLTGHVYSAAITRGGVIVAVVGGAVKISRDRGLTWFAGGAGPTGSLPGVTTVGDLIIIVVPDPSGANPRHWVSKDHGATWQ